MCVSIYIGEYLASKKFSYLHIEMVQVAIKPLTRKGIYAIYIYIYIDTHFVRLDELI